MRTLFIGITLMTLGLGCGSEKKKIPEGVIHLRGAGASFPNPLYQKWVEEFNKTHADIMVEFESVGSGKGVDDFLAGKVDFGASDRALSDEQIAKVKNGVQLVPTTGGMIVLAYNPQGLPAKLKLNRDVYADIFLGKITKWNDSRIAATNPGFEFPDTGISIVVRQDSSGTTFAFTNHLSAISEPWRNGPGAGSKIHWPGGATPEKGNEGVVGLIKRTPGAIGYVEYGLASRLKLPMALLENKSGEFIRPVGGSGLATLLSTKMPDNFRLFIADPDGRDSYPIVTYTWMMAHKKYDDPKKAEAMERFLHWCMTEGQQYCETLGFVRLPPGLAQDVNKSIGKLR